MSVHSMDYKVLFLVQIKAPKGRSFVSLVALNWRSCPRSKPTSATWVMMWCTKSLQQVFALRRMLSSINIKSYRPTYLNSKLELLLGRTCLLMFQESESNVGNNVHSRQIWVVQPYYDNIILNRPWPGKWDGSWYSYHKAKKSGIPYNS